MPWQTIFAILQMIWAASSPALKAAALAELKLLETQYAGHPILLALIKEAEVLVAAAVAAPHP